MLITPNDNYVYDIDDRLEHLYELNRNIDFLLEVHKANRSDFKLILIEISNKIIELKNLRKRISSPKATPNEQTFPRVERSSPLPKGEPKGVL